MEKELASLRLDEIKSFFTFWDKRFDDYSKSKWTSLLARDLIAGLVVALVAIPLGIGFSIASGMRPEQGIIAGAVAGFVGGIFGGSKYQVYGPTAAFIPIIASIIEKYDVPFLLLASVVAGAIILLLGILRLGKYFAFVPHSVIVGFTIGIALTIAVSQAANIFGETGQVGYKSIEKMLHLPHMFVDAHAHAMVLAIATFFIIRKLTKISVFIPSALIAMVLTTYCANNIWHDHLIPIVSTQYGDIGGRFFALTLPALGKHSLVDLVLPVASIVFIGALESLLSSRMADRLANNKTLYSPNKELFGQGVVNIIVPLFNGFPCTGALARTATNIKSGAVSPFSSILKAGAVVLLMLFGANYLETVPMAFIGGLLVYVAFNMVKKEEIEMVFQSGKWHVFLMAYTAIMTFATDLSLAVVSATIFFYLGKLVSSRAGSMTVPVQVLEPVPVTSNDDIDELVREKVPS
jgi:sulfate permease, SulP family